MGEKETVKIRKLFFDRYLILYICAMPDKRHFSFIVQFMNVYHDLNQLPAFKNAVLTIGSFDGVHRGHQKLLDKINHLARDVEGESIVVTFHPHPRLVIYPKDDSLRLITTIDEKIAFLERFKVDNVVVVPFSVEFSQQSADEYIEKFLVEKFQPKHIVIGYDHRFGLNRQGDINYLKWHSERHGFEVIEIEKQEVEELAISSTKIRESLQKGNVKGATDLLNHYFTLTGTVVDGQKIGTNIGFPTANLEVTSAHKLVPPTGIYAVYVWHNGNRYKGMLYIGNRPTIARKGERSIEVNIFDFDKNIYGDKLRLEFVAFTRSDRKFDNLEQLKAQLQLDKEDSLKHLEKESAFIAPTTENEEASVAIVILNYNGREFLGTFLPSILASTYSNTQIYVADNGSDDSSIAYVQSMFPSVRIIDLEENHGFAKGYNLALEQVESDYYIILNSDVEVTPNWIEPIIELMERDRTVAACQPKILSYQEKTQFEHAGAAGGWIDKWGYPFCRGRVFNSVEQDEGQYDKTQEIFWASGAALFIRANLFHNIGGFDEDYFAHMEEIDLCWRLKRAGYKIMVRPKSVVYHVGGGTLAYENPRKTYLNFRNSLNTIAKNETRKRLLWLLPLRLVLDGLAGGLFLVKGQFKNIQAIVQAHWSFFPSLPQIREKRSKIREAIQKTSIGKPNMTAVYPKSIVWQYYIGRKKRFKDLGR